MPPPVVQEELSALHVTAASSLRSDQRTPGSAPGSGGPTFPPVGGRRGGTLGQFGRKELRKQTNPKTRKGNGRTRWGHYAPSRHLPRRPAITLSSYWLGSKQPGIRIRMSHPPMASRSTSRQNAEIGEGLRRAGGIEERETKGGEGSCLLQSTGSPTVFVYG